jgi:hypothetical protein
VEYIFKYAVHSVKMQPFGIPFLSRKVVGRILAFIIPLAVVLLAYTVLHEDLQILFIFILLSLVFAIYRFDSRIPIGYAIILFIIQGVLTAQGEDVFVESLAVLSYWLLVAGIVCMIIDLCRKKAPVQTLA